MAIDKKTDDVMTGQFDDGLGNAREIITPGLVSLLGSMGKTGEIETTSAASAIASKVSEKTGQIVDAMSEEELVELIRKQLPPEVLENATNYAKLMQPYSRAGSAMTGTVPYRESLRESVFLPNFRQFIALIKETPVLRKIMKYVEENQCVVSLNLHSSIFDRDAWRITPEYDGSVREQHQDYVDKMSTEPDLIRNNMGWPGATGTTKHLNGMVFERADLEEKIALKLLDNLFGGDWNYGSSLELGDRSVFKTGSFKNALADRIRFAQMKWTAMCDEDRKAWLAGAFTHSKDACQGRYDSINLAGPNKYTG